MQLQYAPLLAGRSGGVAAAFGGHTLSGYSSTSKDSAKLLQQ